MKRKTKLIIWLSIGILLSLGPIWGMLGTVVGMVMAFGNLADGQPETSVLASNISLALYTTAAGWIACPIGIVITVISAIRLGKTKTEPEEIPSHNLDPISDSADAV